MNDEKKGIEKAREKADELKAEKAEADAKAEKSMEAVKTQLETIAQNKDLAQMYAENAQVGAENIAGSLPLLKVHQVGKSKNTLSSGGEPENGNFFYQQTGEEFKEVLIHVLTISRGFKAPGLNGEGDDKFNQILGGCIIEEGNFKPFIMYFTGKKLKNLWEFGKEAAKYTHKKPLPIPMFALTVKLTSEKKDNNYGYSFVVNFEIVKNEDGSPSLIMDPGIFTYIRDNVEDVAGTINSLIAAKASAEEAEEVVIAGKVADVQDEDLYDPSTEPEAPGSKEEEVAAEDISF